MIVPLIAAALAHATAPAGSAPAAVPITAADGQLRASQIAHVPPLRDTVIATLPEGAGKVTMSEAARLGLIRNRFPGARYRLRQLGEVLVVRDTVAVDADAACAVSRTPIAAGAYLASDDLGRVACRAEATGGWLGYDAGARSFFARREIPAETYLGRASAGAVPAAREGAELVYRTSEGPVTVEREVVALQSGRVGQPVFVRTEEGKVLSATLSGAEDAR
jgi:flagella basal body P-ring formation protein FlgA